MSDQDHGVSSDSRSHSSATSNHDVILRNPSPRLLAVPMQGGLTSRGQLSPAAGRIGTVTVRPSSNPRHDIFRRLSYDDLARDGSNPRSRTRTPLRYESPRTQSITPETLRIANTNNQEVRSTITTTRTITPTDAQRTEGQRVTVRPLAGAPIGTALIPRRLQEAHRIQTPSIATHSTNNRSSKQGPSHHKVRRWNNDNFISVATDLARHSKPGVAENLLLAKAEETMYQSINPHTHTYTPSVLTTLLQDDQFKSLRDQFINGHSVNFASQRSSTSTIGPTINMEDECENPITCLRRIHDRLRHVVIRACASSNVTTNIVNALESCLKTCFLQSQERTHAFHFHDFDSQYQLVLRNILRNTPTVTRRPLSGHITVRFSFNTTKDSSSGFHRLLLHALCQFHGLTAMSSTHTMSLPSMTTPTPTTYPSISRDADVAAAAAPTTTTITSTTSNSDVEDNESETTGNANVRLLTVTGKRIMGADLVLTECLNGLT